MPRRVKKRRKVQTDDGVSILPFTRHATLGIMTNQNVAWQAVVYWPLCVCLVFYFVLSFLRSQTEVLTGGFWKNLNARERRGEGGGGRSSLWQKNAFLDKLCLFSMLLEVWKSVASKPIRKHPILNLREKESELIGITRKPFQVLRALDSFSPTSCTRSIAPLPSPLSWERRWQETQHFTGRIW